MAKKVHSVGELNVDKDELLQKGYSAKEMVGKTFTINAVRFQDGDLGEFAQCDIEGEGIESDKPFNTGAKNIMARLKAADEVNAFPLEVTVIKLGGNAFDIE